MIELTNSAIQAVTASQPVIYNTVVVKSGCAEKYTPGSSQVTLACGGRYLVTFSGNVEIPSAGTAGEIDVAIMLNGEPVVGGVMKVTQAEVNDFANISTQHYIDVPKTCSGPVSQIVSVANVGTISINVDNPTLTVVRVNG